MFKSADGTQIEGCLLYPYGYRPDGGPYPMIVSSHGGPHAATQPPLVIASGAAGGIPQQPLPAVASELAVVRRSNREPNWEPYATTIHARIRIDPDTARAWSAPPDHSSDDAGRMVVNFGSEGRGGTVGREGVGQGQHGALLDA